MGLGPGYSRKHGKQTYLDAFPQHLCASHPHIYAQPNTIIDQHADRDPDTHGDFHATPNINAVDNAYHNAYSHTHANSYAYALANVNS